MSDNALWEDLVCESDGTSFSLTLTIISPVIPKVPTLVEVLIFILLCS